MEVIHTEIDIETPPETVWRALTDFTTYPEWNPFIRRVEGELRPGARLQVRIEPPGGKGMTFRPALLRVEPNRELRWLGRLFVPGLFDGEHSFIIETFRPTRVRFFQREIFRGLLVPMLRGQLDVTRRGFEEMNEALKARAERAGD